MMKFSNSLRNLSSEMPAVVIISSVIVVVLMGVGVATPIEYLPGFAGKLPFTLQTGYIGVGESEEIQIFYYFVESERSPREDPLLLWLTGGPGCSGFSSLIYEIGPMSFDYGGSCIPTLVSNPYSYSKVANLLFVDQPAGTGFSYANNPQAYKSSDTISANRTFEFLRQWLINHPKYLENPLYIGGGSYSGIIVPLVVNQVYKDIEAGGKLLANMKGYILGNPITDMHKEENSRVGYAHRMGLLSDELYTSAKENCHGNYQSVDPDNNLCKDDLERVNQCLDKISKSHILEPWCDIAAVEGQGPLLPLYEETVARFLQSVPLRSESWCRPMNMLYSYKWANIKSVQKALHVREGTITEWKRCNSTLKSGYTYDGNSTVDYHKMFTRRNCRALIYSGDHDMVAPHTATEEWIRSLKLRIQNDWRPWFVQAQITGYTTAYVQDDYELTYATVKGAGHTPSEYKPLECFQMIQRWLNHNPL